MSDREPTPNPYAPAASIDDAAPTPPPKGADSHVRKLSLRRTAIRWIAVCSLSAMPSFMFGLAITNGQTAGMVTGILFFVAAYTILDYQTATRPFRHDPVVRRTLRVSYGTRMAISVLFPLGAYVDLWCGMLSIGLTQGFTGVEFRSGTPMGYGGALLTTLVQGVLLNLVLGAYAMLIYGLQWFVISLRRQ